MRAVRHRAIVALTMSAAVLVGATSLQGAAEAAEPNCVVTDNLDKATNSAGGNWQLQLNAECNGQSAVVAITWAYEFWAEPQGGGQRLASFTKLLERRTVAGQKNLVRVTAPLGYGRYCYKGTAELKGPKVLEAPQPEHQIGTHCKDT